MLIGPWPRRLERLVDAQSSLAQVNAGNVQARKTVIGQGIWSKIVVEADSLILNHLSRYVRRRIAYVCEQTDSSSPSPTSQVLEATTTTKKTSLL